MARQYEASELISIGQQCSRHLPPASAVQAMFLYEMQRETELESLFHGQMFRLAKADDQLEAQNARIRELEEQVKHLEKRLATKEVEERLATSKVRTDALQAKLNHQKQGLDGQSERLVLVEETLKIMQWTKTEAKTPPANDSTELISLSQTVAATRLDLLTANDEIGVLFDERDALVTALKQANERIDKLEGLVRALTLQSPSEGSDSSSFKASPMTVQLLPVRAPNGQQLDLSVPKGKALAPHLKENRAPIRTFTPGKQWAT